MMIVGRLLLLLAVLAGGLTSCTPAGGLETTLSSTEPPEATATSTDDPTATPSIDEIAADSSIDIFDANTFPERFSAIANNWMEASEADRALYQEFVEAARAAFFEREGIADEVANMKGITEELRSLWGMIYWVQTNRDQVIDGQITRFVTPLERPLIMQEPVFESRIEIAGNRALSYGINVSSTFSTEDYNSDRIGLILGASDFNVGRRPFRLAGGDVALIDQPFPDDPNTLFVVFSMRPQVAEGEAQQYVLFGATVLLKDLTLRSGDAVFGSGPAENTGPFILPDGAEIHLGPARLSDNSLLTREELFNMLGKNVGNSTYGLTDYLVLPDGTQFQVSSFVDPTTRTELIGGVQDYGIGGKDSPNAFPFSVAN